MQNIVGLIGRLTKDPDVRELTSGSTVCSFTLAVDRSFKDKDGNKQTDFIPVVAWGKTAELAGNYLSKGRQVGLKGRIQTRSYDANDGSKRYVTEVVAEELSFLSSGNQNQGQVSNSEYGEAMDGFSEIEDDEFMPF